MRFEPTQRLQTLPPYLFVEIDRKKRAAIEAGKDVINLGVGDPDQATPEFIVDRMAAAIRVPANHRYPFDHGSPDFKQQVAAFFQKRYRVRLDPVTEILTVIGSKEGIGHLPLAVVNPGDVVLIPEPGYPVYRSATLFAGGLPHVMPLTEERAWLPDFGLVPPDVAARAKLMFLNYPNNPTGAVALHSFFEEAVAFAARHNIVLAHDAAYNEVYFDKRPPSVLEVSGGKDFSIEFHSLSKTFNMTGWRLGFAAGNADVLAALARIKANLDSGQFSAIQEAGAEAYAGIDRPEIAATNEVYRERHEIACAGLARVGFRVRPASATFYVWAGVPKGCDSMGVVSRILEEAAVVCVPGTGFGTPGEGYVRFALTSDTRRIRTAIERITSMKW